MSDPQHMSNGDWLGLGGLAATVVGSVVGGVKSMLGKRDERLTKIESTVYGSSDQEGHDTKLALLSADQKNVCNRISDLQKTIDRQSNLFEQWLMKQ